MKATIVIADDDSTVRQFLAEILKQQGFGVMQAASGEQTLDLAHGTQIDAFLVDIAMPRVNGVELCRAIRNLDDHKTTPIICIAGSDQSGSLSRAYEAGCDDFISKPLDAVILRARLKGHLQRLDYFQRLQRARRALQQYLSKRTLEVVETGELPPPEERDLSICFTDMRNFTGLAEETEPNALFSLVSSLLAEQVDIVHQHGGYVDKFGGDGVMAIFDSPDMVVQSCLCALEILDSARATNPEVAQNIRRFGIGIHTGRAVVGNIGSPDRLDYSAIGNAVNLAARLCGQAEATSIAVSKAVHDAVNGDSRFDFHSERRVPIKGMKEHVTIYTLVRSRALPSGHFSRG